MIPQIKSLLVFANQQSQMILQIKIKSLLLFVNLQSKTYIYIYMRVCVCVYVLNYFFL